MSAMHESNFVICELRFFQQIALLLHGEHKCHSQLLLLPKLMAIVIGITEMRSLVIVVTAWELRLSHNT